ncbi:MAG: glycosyl hydrolase [Myxococcales bacterium]|nr:glycosyl hydrolase [Myxococcales bacterium]
MPSTSEGPVQVSETDGTSGGATGSSDTTTGSPTSDTDSTTDVETTTDTGGDELACPTEFRFALPGGASNPRVAGAWHGFELATATALEGPDGDGYYTATIELEPGLWAYKIVYEQGGETRWEFDPERARRTYVNEIENSAALVRDCSRPALAVKSSNATSDGSFTASLSYIDGITGDGPAPADYTATLDDEGTESPLSADEFQIDPDSGDVSIAVSSLTAGKYTIRVAAADTSGRESEVLRLVYWIEDEPYDWNGALIYMVMTDRFRDGDPGNNGGPTPPADPRGDWQGGDFEGLRQKIADGTLDQLGVRAIWMTPFQTNPSGPYLAADGLHHVTGYHGYWPIAAREADARLGGAAALHALVKEAHAHGIRILQDFVINHVHEDHEYMTEHPDWFRTGCVCGTQDCDWTGHALDCMFAPYLPDIDHRVTEANAAFVDDAIWWLDEFNLDGLRVDAVKHVEEAATRNLAAAVREGFEPAGTRYFLMGETAMGWSDCPDPCNDENYGTISKYVGPLNLDGQFDFVLYHAVSYNTFAYGNKGMLHAAYWLEHGLEKWPDDAVMTPYIGSHDTPRFVSLADYRGQDGAHDPGVAHSQWDNVAEAPGDPEPYRRARIGMAWLLGLPGAPLLYYGDEYGQWGGADPNNRQMWRSEDALNPDESQTLDFVRQLGAARSNIPALRVGTYVALDATEDSIVFGRHLAGGESAVVAVTRADQAQQLSVNVSESLGLAPGTVLADALGGPDATVSVVGNLIVNIPPSGAVILAP